MASSCSPLVTAMLNTMADELERLPLADALAYTAACTDIECNAVMAKRSRQEGAGHWYMVTGLRNDFDQQDDVNAAIAYLVSRGLIERDEDGLVRALDERWPRHELSREVAAIRIATLRERDACTDVCRSVCEQDVRGGSDSYLEGRQMGATVCMNTILKRSDGAP